jgi:hypothetical protein
LHTISTCQNCASTCFSCTVDPSNCISCYKDRYLQSAAPSACIECADGSFNPTDDHGNVGSCFGTCSSSCVACSGTSNFCTKCGANKKLVALSGTCIFC